MLVLTIESLCNFCIFLRAGMNKRNVLALDHEVGTDAMRDSSPCWSAIQAWIMMVICTTGTLQLFRGPPCFHCILRNNSPTFSLAESLVEMPQLARQAHGFLGKLAVRSVTTAGCPYL